MNITATVARPVSVDGSHWYTAEGEPKHSVIAKGTGQPHPTTLADARKLNLLPSVTNILRVLHKQALVDWLIEQACLAVLTTPKLLGIRCSKCDWESAHLTFGDTRFCDKCNAPVIERESLDAFVERVLHTERVQDQEATAARELGTDMHNGLETLFGGGQIDEELRPWIEPAYQYLKGQAHWDKIESEVILVGQGYAGKSDFIGWAPLGNLLVDFKTTKKLPAKASWGEHRLQLSAYAMADWTRSQRSIVTANLYISTVDCGQFVYHENPPWQEDFEGGFAPLVKHWQWSTGYQPQQ